MPCGYRPARRSSTRLALRVCVPTERRRRTSPKKPPRRGATSRTALGRAGAALTDIVTVRQWLTDAADIPAYAKTIRSNGMSVEVDTQRRDCAISVLGGPTTVVDIAGRRIVMDPTFDPPGEHAYLTKTAGPAVSADALGPVDAVLISHDEHPDNLDDD